MFYFNRHYVLFMYYSLSRKLHQYGSKKNLKNYENETDKNGVKISEWAIQTSPGFFKCKYCIPSKILSFEKGKQELIKHAEREKHIKSYSEAMKSKTHQPTIQGLFAKEGDEIKKQVSDLEIALALIFSRHNIQFKFINCLVDILKKYIPDSEIIKQVKLGETKMSYLVNHGIGSFCENVTIDKLKNCIAFGASLDESEVNKENELEIIVNMVTKENGIESCHFTMIDLDGGTAQTITDTFVEAFTEKGINIEVRP